MTRQTKNLRGLVVGCGSIGERHLHNLQRLGISNIAICDQDKIKADLLAQKYRVQKFYDLNSALSMEPNFVFICTYPKSHLEIAKKCLTSNSHLFIEKPLASEPKGVETMLKQADSKKLRVAVGYNMRLHPSLIVLKKYLRSLKPLSIFSEFGNNIKYWRPGLSYKNHYVLKKGGGIILDASHEYDYVRWLINDDVNSVYCTTKKIDNIKTETESIASISLHFKNGTIANLVLDYVRPKYERHCKIIGQNGAIYWEYTPKPQSWKKYDSKSTAKISLSLLNGKKLDKSFTLETNEMYRNEARSFLESIACNKKPIVDGWEALKTLRIGHAALESAKKDKIIYL